jgi:glycine/D-amino acid oxidase-like deaminating enzyme
MREEAALPSDLAADVCIIGAEIAALTLAYLLTKEGQRVIVVDDGPTARGETCRTTAHLAGQRTERPLLSP